MFLLNLTRHIVCVILGAIDYAFICLRDLAKVSISRPKVQRKVASAASYGNIFSGLSAEEAKKKHRELVKRYHPDNPTGDAAMFLRITREYEAYCSSMLPTK